MKLLSPFIFLVLFCWCLTAHAVKEDMPIMAYYGVPDWQTTEENFRIFSECGFTVSIYASYPSLDLLVRACRYADKHNVRIIGTCPEISADAAKAINTLKKERGFFGYFIQDEPSVPEIPLLQKRIQDIQANDTSHAFYVNLLPYYQQDMFVPVAKANSYEAYLNASTILSCQQISFDYYPVTSSGIRATWYQNLELVRKTSLRTGKPFWGFALSVPHIIYPTPTLASLRLQIYVNLAYGAQAIQYFTYWTPAPTDEYDYHDAPISQDGKKTKTYDLVQQMNRELKTVSKLFNGAKVTSVHHLGTLSEGTTRQTVMPANLRSLKIVGRQGAVISQFEKDGHLYLAVVNKSHEQSLTVRIRTRNNTPKHVTKTLQEETVKNNYIIEAGDILLFKLK